MSNIKLKKNIAVTLVGMFSVVVFLGLSLQTSNKVHATEITVYKSPTCGCCKKWVSHLEQSGFDVKSIDKQDMRKVKSDLGVKPQYQSCHTAKLGQYYIEGHVPAADIKKLLAEKPNAAGLAVPGMPMGSPGMEGHRKDKYSVLLVDKKNQFKVYNNH